MGATDKFRASIPEKVIQSRTGHLLLKALRMYENPTDEQHSAACSVLANRRNVTPPEVLKPTQPLAGPVPPTMVQHHEACCVGANKQGNTHMLTMLGMQGTQDTGHLPCVKKLPKRLSDMQASPSSPVVMVQKQDETHSQLNKEG